MLYADRGYPRSPVGVVVTCGGDIGYLDLHLIHTVGSFDTVVGIVAVELVGAETPYRQSAGTFSGSGVGWRLAIAWIARSSAASDAVMASLSSTGRTSERRAAIWAALAS